MNGKPANKKQKANPHPLMPTPGTMPSPTPPGQLGKISKLAFVRGYLAKSSFQQSGGPTWTGYTPETGVTTAKDNKEEGKDDQIYNEGTPYGIKDYGGGGEAGVIGLAKGAATATPSATTINSNGGGTIANNTKKSSFVIDVNKMKREDEEAKKSAAITANAQTVNIGNKDTANQQGIGGSTTGKATLGNTSTITPMGKPEATTNQSTSSGIGSYSEISGNL
jgi:hypothetical protein